MTAKRLDDVSRLIGERRIDPARFAYKQSVNWNDPSRLGATRAQLALRIEELQQAGTVCDELLSLLDELEGMTDDPVKFNRRLVRVDELRTKVYQESAPGIAEDRSAIVSIGGSKTVPAGSFSDLVHAIDWNPLEGETAADAEDKYYAPGVGLIIDDVVKLISVSP